MLHRLLCAFTAAGALLLPLRADTRLLRFPDIHGDKVVFTYGGDLWTAPADGGTAIRLTAHPGLELFARFSPDGKWIAFTGQYDGDEQVYVMPSTGGVPRQLTFYPARGPFPPRWGYDNQVYGWSNDGRKILFRSLRDGWFPGFSRLYQVPLEGGPAEPLPMPESGAGTFAPSGSRLVYSPRARDFRTEKRYGGGQANQLYIFDTETYEAKKISEGQRASRDPMWIGNAIYYDSDRDGHFNLYSYDVPSGKTTQLTFSATYDLRWPSSDRQGRIVYERNGGLEVFDVQTRKSTPIPITVSDDGLARRPTRVAAGNLIESASLSPKGERVLFAARGDIFSAPVEKGTPRNLTRTSGAHDKWPSWSPDGARVAFLSDQSGEEEIWVAPQDGAAKPQQLTHGGKAMRYAPEWSPDGKRIAFSDKDGRLFVAAVADGKLAEIAHSTNGEIRDYQWAPRGEFLAYTLPNPNTFGTIHVWSGSEGRTHRVTSDYFDSNSPAWDPDGNYLYFIANHDFAPLLSSVEFNFATNRQANLYALALRAGVKSPFPFESDEVSVTGPEDKKAEEKKAEEKKAEEKKAEEKKDLAIDFDGLESRVVRVPLEASNYSDLKAKAGHLLYTVNAPPYYGRAAEIKNSVRIYSIKDRKETTLMEDAGGFQLSRDGSKVLISQGASYQIMDATPSGAAGKKTVSTAALFVDRVPAEEWAQIFDEVWRRYRDFFYAPNMHGYDWEAVRQQYRPFLEHVADRTDLNYVISEMISELTVQHAYIDGGDRAAPPRPRVALPGARFELDRASNRFRISRIFEGQNEEDIYRSPLKEIGVDAKVGDYVLAINGQELTAQDDPYRLLRNLADGPVQLTLNSQPAAAGSRTVTFRPITDETKLLYLDWVNANRRKVTEMTGGRIGYLHLPDMGADGIREFVKWYYPQIRKEGLIVDVRANGGGNISRMVIERLTRRVLAAQFARTVETPFVYPDAFAGPMVALLNENSASDGDIFPAMFREAKLGPLIGKRSWGGTVGISDHGQLIDGGHVNVPEFGFANTRGEWIIEGHGVDPDIEVDNDPRSVIQGKDPQLDRAVAEVMARLKSNPPTLPTRPPDPVKLK